MNKSTSNECVAQGAATWNEREEHMRIMKAIDEVTYWHETHHTTDEEWAMMSDLPATWTEVKVSVLPEREVVHILKRNNPEEILFMLKKYEILVNAKCSGAYFTAEAQEIIARRNNKTEMMVFLRLYGFCDSVQMIVLNEWKMEDQLWYTNYHGFGTDGQIHILNNWDHENIMTYIRHHGFTSKGEKALINRGNHDEIMTYLHVHKLHNSNVCSLIERGDKDEINKLIAVSNYSFPTDAEELMLKPENSSILEVYTKRFSLSQFVIMNMLDNIDDPTTKGAFIRYIKCRRLDCTCEKKMLDVADEETFKEYVSRYSLEHANLAVLAEKRSEDDVMYYVSKRKMLSTAAEIIFFKNASDVNILTYIENCKSNDVSVINVLINIKPVNYELLTLAFLNCQNQLSKDEALSSASRDEVIARISEEKELTSAEVVALFFRNEPDLFEQYINTHEVKF